MLSQQQAGTVTSKNRLEEGPAGDTLQEQVTSCLTERALWQTVLDSVGCAGV